MSSWASVQAITVASAGLHDRRARRGAGDRAARASRVANARPRRRAVRRRISGGPGRCIAGGEATPLSALLCRSRGHAAVDHPRDRAGAHRVPADLELGAPAHRPRLLRVGRSGRRASPPSCSSGRCWRSSSTSAATSWRIGTRWLASLRNPELRSQLDARMGWYLIWATIPIGIIGLAVRGLDRDDVPRARAHRVHAHRARASCSGGRTGAARATGRSPTSSSRTASSWARRRRSRSCRASRARARRSPRACCSAWSAPRPRASRSSCRSRPSSSAASTRPYELVDRRDAGRHRRRRDRRRDDPRVHHRLRGDRVPPALPRDALPDGLRRVPHRARRHRARSSSPRGDQLIGPGRIAPSRDPIQPFSNQPL